MRLWSLHPSLLDARGLVALWREALLAQAVLRGRTRAYRQHPQLERFRQAPRTVGAIADYLRAVQVEASRRGYRFDASKINRARANGPLQVTRGQLCFETGHLMTKLLTRDPEAAERLRAVRTPKPHPLFRIVPGAVESWERVNDD